MFCVAVESFEGVERQYFNTFDCAYTEYARLLRFGRRPYLYYP